MTNPSTPVFTERQTTIIDLPLPENTELLHPENTMVRVGRWVFDIGSFCYARRSSSIRKAESACEVVLESLLKERIPQIASLIREISKLLSEGGKRDQTVYNHCLVLKYFMAWADQHGLHDCLSGGDASRNAYHLYAQDVEDQVRRHMFGTAAGTQRQKYVLVFLEALTGLEDLSKGIRLIRHNTKGQQATQPASQHDFTHALALNEALFRGLCDLVLEPRPFPFQLQLPQSLGWEQNHLWLFPTPLWFLHPESKRKLGDISYIYDKGTLASEETIWAQMYGRSEKVKRYWARHNLKKAQATLDQSNADPRSYYRLMLASIAQNAFFFLFLANTGGNLQAVIDIETDGSLVEGAVSQGYRSTKWRASGKEVDLIIPVAFMPTLRRFLELRAYLLDGAHHPYLFLNRGKSYVDSPSKLRPAALMSMHRMMMRIDPELQRISARKIRATVADYYHRQHDAAVTAAVLQNTEATALKNYNAGSETDQQVEVSLLLQKIATKAQTQVIRPAEVQEAHRPLEDGGVCPSYGHPESLSADAPVTPNCKTGCLFCAKRVLIANEDDTRKVASAAFLMERLIMGPLSEAEYRPQIAKCDQDLDHLRAFEGCADMVDRIKADVYENGNLTPYFADKYQLFLTLGVL